MIKKTFLLLLSSLMLIFVSSCGKNDDINTIYGHFKNLKEAQNYTITTDVVTLKKTETYSIYFTETGYYFEDNLEPFGYIGDSQSSYFIDYYHNNLTPSREIETPLWNGTNFISFKSFDLNLIKDAKEKEYIIENNIFHETYFLLINIFNQNIKNIENAKAYIEETSKVLTIEYAFSSGYKYISRVHNIGETKIDVLDSYLASGGSYYTYNEEEQRTHDLFRTQNYCQIKYDNNDGTTFIGYNYFNKDYIFNDYTDEYLKIHPSYYETGYIGIENKLINQKYYNGLYRFGIHNDKVFLFEDAASTIISTNKITNYFPFPSDMILLDNLQYLIPTGNENEYMCDKKWILDDFAVALNFKEGLESLEATLVKINIKVELNKNDKDCVYTFQVIYKIYEEECHEFLSYSNFGNANIPAVDQFLSSL